MSRRDIITKVTVTGIQLLIDKAVVRDCRKRNVNLAMGRIGYRESYNLILWSWITESLEMFGVVENLSKFSLTA